MAARKPKGLLILSGGNDSSDGAVMARIVEETKARGGKIVICTSPSAVPEETGPAHRDLFRELGLKKIEILDLRVREQALEPDAVDVLEGAGCVFFTGGDQLRLTATIADSPVFQRTCELYREGAVVAGTSAGSAAMPSTMLISGDGDISPEATEIGMAPGLGLADGYVLDTHFAERGRIGRLLAAVAQNPKNLGLGIDEDTAVVIAPGGFSVLGRGAVYVVDGRAVRYSSLSGQSHRGVTSIFGVRLHVLADGDRFDAEEREPVITKLERLGKRDEARDSDRRTSES